jgi:hypothetical protein
MNLVFQNERSLTNCRKETEFGKKIGLFGVLFGCWHQHLSRPFTHHKQSYCVCLDCGARRHFNPQTLETNGAYYYPPDISLP